jgi:CRISPR-associated exonuclease Cas4
MYSEDDLLPLSGLQHLMFCERQWGLIHIEQIWEENRLTAEGRVLHERAHQPGAENRPNTRTSRGLRLHSLRLGLVGQADIVEFHRSDDTDATARARDCPEVRKPLIKARRAGAGTRKS